MKLSLPRFQLPDSGPDNRFRYYGDGDPDVDANDREEAMSPENQIPLTQRCESCAGMTYRLNADKSAVIDCPACGGTGRKNAR